MGGLRFPRKGSPPPTTRLTRAVAMHHAGDPAGALEHYRRELRKNLNNPVALYFAALAKDQLGDDRETAIPYMLKALQLLGDDPRYAELRADAFFNLSKFYLSTGDDDRAFAGLMAALEHNPQHTESLVGVGDHLYQAGDSTTAAQYWTAAIASTPRCPEAFHYRSFIRLRCGDPDGWADYEARWACKMFVHQYGRREYENIPLWVDQELMGKRIIVHGEQGHGDVIQCARYLPLLRDRGATVILEAHKPLVRLMRHSFPWLDVFERETVYDGVVDLHIPSFSLPHRLGGIEVSEPYLKAPDNDLIPHDTHGRRRIALCWRGSKIHSNDRNRSCPVEHFAPLWSVPNVEYVSLQIGDAADEAHGTPMNRLDDHIRDFADSANILAGCDLVISVDTAVAHLAGALGRPVWLMTPVLSEWRWGIEESTTDLYPSMRIFRQQRKGDWGSVIEQVRSALTEVVHA